MDERSRTCSSALDSVEKSLADMCRKHAGSATALLDVGCWDGLATRSYADFLGATEVYGLEYFEDALTLAVANGVDARQIDLERETFPFSNQKFDVVVCNQVFEHLKNIYLATDEIARVLKPQGTLLFSVPNLASLHNRVLLGLGRQPTSIRVIGPHVRSFTPRSVVNYFESGGLFELERQVGNGFPPLSGRVADLAARLMGVASHSLVFEFKRTDRPSSEMSYVTVGDQAGIQTVFS